MPDLPSVPVQPIILAMQEEPGMFDFYRNCSVVSDRPPLRQSGAIDC